MDEEWVHCRAKPGVLSLPGLLPPPAPVGATGGRRRRRGRGVSALPAPQVDGGSSPSERLLTNNTGNSSCPLPAQDKLGREGYKVRGEEGQTRGVRME